LRTKSKSKKALSSGIDAAELDVILDEIQSPKVGILDKKF